ncbi:transcription factor BHLH062-like [Zingiber officinale]|uniref:transcription factor BHLH062-like n=1 Tax=Zingiber officinale TaxID=94328 RepID=UPI001C4BA23B|nr:transcription factor BHLH062-like [Zingiber officinale]XP_042430238.1 transcription factor BHLH062-like [Zingiber officinale]
MVSENIPTTGNESNVVAAESQGSLPYKKGLARVPKKIHKAEREKLKRDQLNEHFVELGHVLEPDRQNNCKASILGDTTRVLRDLFAQVNSLGKENAALLSESRYVTVERNELKDENNALQSEISLLQNELQRRTQSVSVWNDTPSANPLIQPQPTTSVLSMQHPPFIIGSNPAARVQELQLFPVERTPPSTQPGPPPQVTRPHARYPAPLDLWSGQLLSTLPQTSQREIYDDSSTSTTSKEGCDKP